MLSLTTIVALKKGDRSVFSEVYFLYHEKIFFFVKRKTDSPYIAEEVTQLAFIKLWQSRENLSESHPLFSQLFRIVQSVLIDELRKQATYLSKTGKVIHLSVDEYSDVLEKLSEKEMRSRIMKIVEAMPSNRRKVFEMNRLQGMSYKQIAEQLSLSVKTVEYHLLEALKQLKRELGHHLPYVLLMLAINYF